MIKLLCGDCLVKLNLIPDHSIDLILADPPYGTTQNHWDSLIPTNRLWPQLIRVLKPAAPVVLTATQPFTSLMVMSNQPMFKYTWTWIKPKATGHLNAKKQPLRNTEDILVFYKNQPTYNPQMTQGEPFKAKAGSDHTASTSQTQSYGKYTNKRSDNTGTRYPKTTLHFNTVQRNTVHPTQKPVELMEYLIRTYTNPGDTVLDFSMGSGSTGVAAVNLSRSFVGIELNRDYFDIAKQRIVESRRRRNPNET